MHETTDWEIEPVARVRRIALIACAALLALLLAGCAGASQQAAESSDVASLNRSYMAQVNQRMADLGGVLEEFQAAVGEGDAVAMQASQAKAARIIDEVKGAKAPQMLENVKAGYVEGLDQLQSALGAYVQLYNDAQAGRLDEASFNDRLVPVQDAYNAGIAALKRADEAAVAVAQADGPMQPASSGGSSGGAASSQAASANEASSGGQQDATQASAAAAAATAAGAAAVAQSPSASSDAATQQEAGASSSSDASGAAQGEAIGEEAPSQEAYSEPAADYQGDYGYVEDYGTATDQNQYQEY